MNLRNSINTPESIPIFPEQASQVDTQHLEKVTAPRYRRKNLARLAIATATSLTPVSCIANSYSRNDWISTRNNDSGEMIEYAEGCEPFTLLRQSDDGATIVINGTATEQQIIQTLDTEAKFKHTRSAAENFEPQSFNFIETAKEWIDVFGSKQYTYKSKYSGVVFHIYSDKPDAFESFDLEAFDEITHAILNPDIKYNHISIQQFADCMKRRFIESDGPRELEGKDINVFIPSDYGVCWVNGQIQDKPPRAKSKEFCDSIGGTKYMLDLSIGPVQKKSSWVVTMPTSSNIETAQLAMSQYIAHEFGHLFTQAGGLPFELIPNEKVVDMLEQEALQQIYPDVQPVVLNYHPKPSTMEVLDAFFNTAA